MILLPRTLLARTFLLAAALVLATTSTWLIVFRIYEAEPRAREAAQLAASAVNLVRAALLASSPEKRPDFFSDVGAREGIRLLPAETEDRLGALPDERFYRLLQLEVAARLGPKTRVAMSVNDESGFWVSFHLDDEDDDEYWVVLPPEHAEIDFAWHWLTWGVLALALALLFAWWLASRLSRPLAALAEAASTVGRGERPNPVAEVGAEEMQQLARAFNRMATDLEQHERDRAEVLAGISHDLRTPLTRLRLEAEMSLADESTRQAVVADIEQMEAVIAQFLDYARGEQGEAAEETDTDRLLDDIAARHRRPGRSLIAEIAPLAPSHLRPKALARAVDNLIENAFKYGGGEVTLSAFTQAHNLVIEVLDRGPGIPEADAERVRRPFIRLDSARSEATGTGLGLAIVERIARLHGGRLDLLPREGGGLRARLILPIK